MELEHVKQVFVKEGEVNRILKGDVVLWQKVSGILITDFQHYRYAVYTIPAPADVPEDITPVWNVSELPQGLSYQVTADGLTISGYAEKVCRKNVTVTLTIGEDTEDTLYTFEVKSDGNEIAIASGDLGYWHNHESGVISGTTALSISGSGGNGGSVRYYSSGNPSWMTINTSSGALSGTPNTGYENQSGYVTVYAIRGGLNIVGSYRTPNKVLRWSTGNAVPHFRYTHVKLDCTNDLRLSGTKYTFFNLDLSQFYYPIEGGTNDITYTINDTEGKHVTPSISGNTLSLYKKSRCTTTSGCDSYITIRAKNSKGSSALLYIHCDVHAKKDDYSWNTVIESVS